MAATVKETVTTDNNSVTRAVSAKEDETITWIRVIYFVLGVIEVLLAFRFVFRATGANSGTQFVALIYSLTAPLIEPFAGIFGRVVASTAVIEPTTLVAMAVYAILFAGIVKLTLILTRQPETEV
ncbi:MAG TPA: YggT family protein [Candidatus Saccharimonadia bacterium]|nr:YggT family protein [Candidatus Saccharimonadia bacterium]